MEADFVLLRSLCSGWLEGDDIAVDLDTFNGVLLLLFKNGFCSG